HDGKRCHGDISIVSGQDEWAMECLNCDRVGRGVCPQHMPGCECQGDEVHTVAFKLSGNCRGSALAWCRGVIGGEDRDINVRVAFCRTKSFWQHIERFSCHGTLSLLSGGPTHTNASGFENILVRTELIARIYCAEAVDQGPNRVPG